MKYRNYYIEGTNGKSNCVIRSFCKLYDKKYDDVYQELIILAKDLNCSSFNDIEVFEKYMEQNKTKKISFNQDIKIKDLEIDNSSYIIFCWDKKEYYHMVTIIDNVLYDKDDNSMELYPISIYKKTSK